ncbi:MAG TPA: GNAT family N-acetyltransferase [Actinomycetota bacterium]|nr:GNAT family N-acetyltransferase [Actinomycetota bacterium]
MVRRAINLTAEDVSAVRALLAEAWDDDDERITDEDWEHAIGGVHFLLEDGGKVLAHASVIERELHTQGHRLPTGYVEAVATRHGHRGRGHGSAVMAEATTYIDRTFRLGALSTGRTAFYERLGWVVWRGPTFVRTGRGTVPTPDDDGGVMVRLTPSSPRLDLTAPISCEWRPGDVW